MEIPGIISVDDHVIEPAHLWQRWLPAEFRDRGPKIVRLPWERGPGYRQPFRPAASGPMADFWVVGDITQAILTSQTAAGRDSEDIVDGPTSFDEMRPGCYDPRARLVDMDVVGVEKSLCFPNNARFCGQLFLWIEDKELAMACMRAYNDWMVEEWAGDSDGRLVPLCVVPLWDAQAAAAEIRRNAARGVRAVTFSELPAQLGLPSIHDKDGYWLPFIEACDETSTVICIHIGSSSTLATTSADAPKSVTLASTTFNSQLAMTDWLLSGHLARFPNLKLAFSESQIGWMPFLFERVDKLWARHNPHTEVNPIITKPPSSYVQGRVFGCMFDDDFGVESIEHIGVDQVTFECDYPHQDSTWPETRHYAERALAHLSDEDVYKIVRGNALRMLDLTEETVSPAAVARS